MKNTADDSAKRARQAWMRALQQTAQIESRPWLIFPVLIDELADRYESATALTSPEATLSYRELSERCNRYARWGMGAGLRPGDVVSLLMPNCAEYLAAWLGLTRLGASVALVNTQLRGQMLAAAIRTAGPACILVDASLAAVLEDCRPLLPARPACWVRGVHGTGFETIDAVLAGHAGVPLTDAECPPPTPDATALYIYTSGTTGLPKAARVSHRRVMQWSHWFAGLLDTGPADRMYDCLPLYHSVGGVVATGATLLGGGAVVIRPRFSVTEFWADVAAERCTLFQYIGELCRYLVNAPPRAEETRHALRVACGNGLRPEVWTSFQQRFKIPHILEYYASTEGNFSLYNCEGEPGAIGRIPPFLRHRLPVELVRFDVAAGEPLRDADGRCARCVDDEVGEAIGRIPVDGTTGPGRFEGYADPVASERKILRDVFAPGDAWYRTGDLMRRDARGFYHFVDRIGDTFRWKGENVSTTEVLSVLTRIEGVLDGVVYGVPVAGAEGRAGMAALMVGPQFDLVRFRAALHRLLPGYARPPFIRLLPGIAATATHKPLKQELVLSGYDPALVRDPLYWDSPGDEAFVSIDAALFAALGTGTLRL